MTMEMKAKRKPKGIDNVLAEIGFDDAEELTAKATLAIKFHGLVEKRGLSQMEASAITGMAQSKISQVRRYELLNISLERLMQALVSLDQHVEIVVRLRISAIVDACCRLIVDGVSAPSWTRGGCAQARGSIYLNRPRSI